DVFGGVLPKEAISFMEKYERKSPFSYISVLNPITSQGAKFGCSGEGLQNTIWFCTKPKNHKTPWLVYADAAEINGIQKRFKHSGIDFIFSPFLLIEPQFKEVRSSKAKMFIVLLEQTITMAVFQNGQLLFGKQDSIDHDEHDLDMEEELILDVEGNESRTGLELDINEIDSLDSLDDESDDLESLETLEDLDDLDNLDDLDDNDELGEFTADTLDMQEETDSVEEISSAEDAEKELMAEDNALSGFSINFKRFELIQDALQEFYRQSDVKSSFIEEIFLSDRDDSCKDLMSYLEDELFVKVKYSKIDLENKFLAIVKQEVRNAT
ncbi:MAG: hypothetical protein OEW60_06245, partial [Thiovulaceae bacterium]|nr:hypothetical protein [Sulfurimonadaceae bacterium]